jgi:hypothetical protein
MSIAAMAMRWLNLLLVLMWFAVHWVYRGNFPAAIKSIAEWFPL